ncbi:MAG: threonylcarbamoyl-AMP synthase [Pirellulaceae bacterium]|nr:threonylcarbamoyl-AMP synthase [Pirellulaceae bacterium]
MDQKVIGVHQAVDRRDLVHQAVQALIEGEVLVLPTETVYGLAAFALCEKAVDQILKIKGRKKNHPMALALCDQNSLHDYIPEMPPLAERLVNRALPGPLTVVLDDRHTDSLLQQLPTGVQEVVSPQKTVGIRVPDHSFLLEILRLLPGPLVLTSANLSGDKAPTTAQEAIESLGERVRLVFDDGPTPFSGPSTVIKIEGQRFELLREGVVTKAALKNLATCQILLVCTGNTCRSPMAELLFRKRLAERFGCSDEELKERGVVVHSAGIAAFPGCNASNEAVRTLVDYDLDLTEHQSQLLNDKMVRQADLILTMTNAHYSAILAHWPQASMKTQLLAPNGEDVPDPIGGDTILYQECAKQIDRLIIKRLEELEIEKDLLQTNDEDK